MQNIPSKAFAMPFTNPAFPPGPYKFVNREFLIITYRTDMERLRKVVPAPLDFPPMQYYQLWHERCHYSDEVRWLRSLIAEATKTLIDKP